MPYYGYGTLTFFENYRNLFTSSFQVVYRIRREHSQQDYGHFSTSAYFNNFLQFRLQDAV